MLRVRASVSTPFGAVGLEASAVGIARVWLPGTVPFRVVSGESGLDTVSSSTARAHLARAANELADYFAGCRNGFTVALDWQDASVGFAGRVQRALLAIPYGERVSYGELAARLGRPRAARAVGGACSKNPLPLFVACHRVIRADGSIGEYVGGEAMKRVLLGLESSSGKPH